jgi:hypothetical protein
MFGISFEQLIVLLTLALILFGPDKLPEYAEKMGRWVAKMRQASQEVRNSYHAAVNAPLTSSPAWGFCPHCGKTLGDDFTFCPHCGQRLKPEPYAIPTPTDKTSNADATQNTAAPAATPGPDYPASKTG